MAEEIRVEGLPAPAFNPPASNRPTILLLQAGLFVVTFLTTTLAGVQWVNKDPFQLENFSSGLTYSLSLLAVLGSHEFGHYIAARIYKLDATLPFFIPVPPFTINPFGTMGAVIRIRSPWTSKKSLFDIGIAGPLAGLVVTLIILAAGMATLPGKEYLYGVHPEYRHLAKLPADGFTLGGSIFFSWLYRIAPSGAFMPPMNEVYHYPLLCVGWFGLFVTALNLIPVGQLDGGHILYSMLGEERQGRIARVFFALLIILGLSSFVPFFGQRLHFGTVGWLVWAAILFFIVKLDHPPIDDPEELSPGRQILGAVTFLIFILILPPIPFTD
jgi:membrane-associated protease RseP (regulator of RpoE activity)